MLDAKHLVGLRPVSIIQSPQKLEYTYTAQFSADYIQLIERRDKETHPSSLPALYHGQHGSTRLTTNLCFLVLRKRKFKILQERENYCLYLKKSESGANHQFVALCMRSGATGMALTRIAKLCTNESQSLKVPRVRRNKLGQVIRNAYRNSSCSKSSVKCDLNEPILTSCQTPRYWTTPP